MATLLLTAVGTAVGGPIGGAVGALVGQQVDGAVFGAGSRDGPRLKELAVTTSSYGQVMPRHFGRMRVAGTVIWATDLIESSSTQGGKGQPKTTTYSYSANFAVALSSNPLARIGRVWADGNLLRGSEGDLKAGGEMRFYSGNGDDAVDPLIAADKGSTAPAFRDCAYVVFEGLNLGDFGNRIPALTFEVFAEDDSQVSLNSLIPDAIIDGSNTLLADTRGFADEGGALASSLNAIDRVHPITCATKQDGLHLASAIAISTEILELPEQLSSDSSAEANTRNRQRGERRSREPLALRYYDEGRDYQPGVQRAIGNRPAGREVMIDLPATMTAQGAKSLANANAHRARWQNERMSWRVGELHPSISAGAIVRVPRVHGLWRITSWEWYDRGLELQLERLAPDVAGSGGSDAGAINAPIDAALSPSSIHVFEAPIESSASISRALFAAVSSPDSNWRGVALYLEQGNTLEPIGTTSVERAVTGQLATALPASDAHIFQPNATLEVEGVGNDLFFEPTDMEGIAAGENRLLVGDEIIQFAGADIIDDDRWRLTGLLRGRGGSEQQAQTEHEVGTNVVLLDDRLTVLDDERIPRESTTRIAAIGLGDSAPVYATLENAGLSTRPLVPVHPSITIQPDSSWELCWIRRARGQWRWGSEFEVPLVEESERFLVGYGPVDAPNVIFNTTEPRLTLTLAEREMLLVNYGPGDLWVRQIGTYSNSQALLLTTLS